MKYISPERERQSLFCGRCKSIWINYIRSEVVIDKRRIIEITVRTHADFRDGGDAGGNNINLSNAPTQ